MHCLVHLPARRQVQMLVLDTWHKNRYMEPFFLRLNIISLRGCSLKYYTQELVHVSWTHKLTFVYVNLSHQQSGHSGSGVMA